VCHTRPVIVRRGAVSGGPGGSMAGPGSVDESANMRNSVAEVSIIIFTASCFFAVDSKRDSSISKRVCLQ